MPGLSALHPAGPAARDIAQIWWVLLAGAAAIFALVMVLLGLALGRRGARGRAVRPGVWLWGLGVAFPSTVLAALTVYGLVMGERLLPGERPGVVSVGAEARQWAWRFAYRDRPGLVTEGVLHIPARRPVDVSVTSLDVVHAFWVPRLAGKIDAIPGHANVLRIEADRPGSYRGQSAEFSGVGYRGHGFEVIAHDAEGWAAFVAGRLP